MFSRTPYIYLRSEKCVRTPVAKAPGFRRSKGHGLIDINCPCPCRADRRCKKHTPARIGRNDLVADLGHTITLEQYRRSAAA